MTPYRELSQQARAAEHAACMKDFEDIKARGLALNMARGKPSSEQLDLSTPMLSILSAPSECFNAEGTDCRNYGVLEGIREARELGALMLDDDPHNIVVLGNSSLTAMYDTIARCYTFGCADNEPWALCDTVKFVCPTPGYDRHFAILEQFGIEMISVPLTDDGPDMDVVEALVGTDPTIKGMWCVPQYSNPSGITYSDQTVVRLASMDSAANDFRIFWDNAYCVHHLFDDPAKQDHVLDIAKACQEAGNPDRYFKFASTSKITFPGAGISFFTTSEKNLAHAKKLLSAQMIGADKLTQLRHARFLPDRAALMKHMEAHAAILRPKFERVEHILEDNLGNLGIATWTYPKGGYFISFDGLPHTAKRTVSLAKEAGVVLTGAGATYPYGNDPEDANIRLAPTLPPLDELEVALNVFTLCVKIAALETLLQ